jgi:microcystin-dependent protein
MITFLRQVLRRLARALAVVSTFALAALCYVSVPPPPPAAAFGEQGTWGGTATGSANALTIAIYNVRSMNDLLGVPIRFKPLVDNVPGPVTVAVGGQAATPLKRPTSIGLQDPGSELQAGVTSAIMFTGSVFEIISPIDMTPIGNTCEYRGAATPRGCMIEDGSCVSQTQFAALFLRIGTTYGTLCGAGQFPVPDSRGTMFVALDGQGSNGSAGRLTTATCSAPNSLAARCGGQTTNLNTSQMAPYTPSGTVSSSATTSVTSTATSTSTTSSGALQINNWTNGSGIGAIGAATTGGTPATVLGLGAGSTITLSGPAPAYTTGTTTTVNSTGSTAVSSSFFGNSNGGSGAAVPLLNPTLLGFRAIKY